MFCFMIYFFILREESDLDLLLTTDPTSMYEKMPGLERVHIKSTIKNYEIEGRDTSDLIKRFDMFNLTQRKKKNQLHVKTSR